MRLYLDANALIYLVEGPIDLREAVGAWIRRCEEFGGVLLTSRVSLIECRAKPLGQGRTDVLGAFDAVFDAANFELIDVTASVIDEAMGLAARHGLRTTDAIHVASALAAKAEILLTGDRRLAKVQAPRIELL